MGNSKNHFPLGNITTHKPIWFSTLAKFYEGGQVLEIKNIINKSNAFKPY